MDILVQSFLNSATKLPISVTTATTVSQLKTLVNTSEGVNTAIMEFYIINSTTTTATILLNSDTLGSYSITTSTIVYSSNTISTSTNKVDRQLAKLELSQLRKQAGGDSSATFYRSRNIYDIDLLADKYTSNTSTVGTTSTLVESRPWFALFIGMDDPANAAEPDATAWVLMDGPFYNTPGVPGSGFKGGQSWRKMAPIGYMPYGRETYVYGDEVVRFDGTWLYENSFTGIITTGGTEGQYPWQASWADSYTAAKITAAYVKTTNYPSVP